MVEATATIELDRMNVHSECDAIKVVIPCGRNADGWLVSRDNILHILRVCFECASYRDTLHEFSLGRVFRINDFRKDRILEVELKVAI